MKMNRKILLFISMFMLCGIISAQTGKLSKLIVWELDDKEYILPGEFKIDFSNVDMHPDYQTVANKFFALVKSEKDYNCIIINGHKNILSKRDIFVKKSGYEAKDVVYVSKIKDKDNWQNNKEILIINGEIKGPYDSIVDVLDDGYVYRNDNIYYFKGFNQNEYNNLIFSIADSKILKDSVICGTDNKLYGTELTLGDKYYQCYDGHFYYLYSNDFMSQSILVVDGLEYELNKKYSEIQFKFSPNGEHWMALEDNCIWYDGAMQPIDKELKIKKFLVADNGEYGFVATNNNSNTDDNDCVMMNGRLFVKNIIVENFELTGHGNWIIKFWKDGRGKCYRSDCAFITDETKLMTDSYFKSNVDLKKKHKVVSTDGKHTMQYQYDKYYAVIDGKNYGSMCPFYAEWNEEKQSFIWNTVDEIYKSSGDTRYVLVVYEYCVER